MSRPMPTHAMLLAAGLGTRMRPLTDRLPKALVPVQGRPLIDWSLERLEAAGVENLVVNLHHHADQLEAHLAARWRGGLQFSREPRLLETGGGLKAALPLLGEAPFFAINADTIWLDGQRPALERLAEAFEPERMDALLLCAPTVLSVGYHGAGDFRMDADGRLVRRPEREVAPFVFASVQILDPAIFAGAPEGAFSMNRLYDRAIERERLFGLRHEAEWFEVGTPGAVAAAEFVLRDLGFRAEAA